MRHSKRVGGVNPSRRRPTILPAHLERHLPAMRHSFASYWLAVHKNAPALAEIMGNSVPIIRRHYENTVLESVAAEFWAIQPEKQ